MQTRVAKLLIVALVLAAPVALAAGDMYAGTWKLNVAKSKFDPGPPPKSVTLIIDPAGKVTVQEEMANGQAHNWGYTANPNGEATIEGMENATVTEKRPDERTIEHTWNFGEHGKWTGRGVLSKNGRMMTYTMSGATPDGKSIHNVEIYEKQ